VIKEWSIQNKRNPDGTVLVIVDNEHLHVKEEHLEMVKEKLHTAFIHNAPSPVEELVIASLACRPVAKKEYRLRDGTRGTEYESLLEVIRHWEAKRQEAEDKLEEYRNRLNLADGHP